MENTKLYEFAKKNFSNRNKRVISVVLIGFLGGLLGSFLGIFNLLAFVIASISLYHFAEGDLKKKIVRLIKYLVIFFISSGIGGAFNQNPKSVSNKGNNSTRLSNNESGNMLDAYNKKNNNKYAAALKICGPEDVKYAPGGVYDANNIEYSINGYCIKGKDVYKLWQFSSGEAKVIKERGQIGKVSKIKDKTSQGLVIRSEQLAIEGQELVKYQCPLFIINSSQGVNNNECLQKPERLVLGQKVNR